MKIITKSMLLMVMTLVTFGWTNAQVKPRQDEGATSKKTSLSTNEKADRDVNKTASFTKMQLHATTTEVVSNSILSNWNRDTWITWSGEPQEAVGAGNNSDFTVAQRFEPSDLTDYDGQYLSKIKFVPSVATCVYEIQIMVGGSGSSGYNSGTMVRNRMLETGDLNIGQWNEIDIFPAVEIDASQELWIAVRCISQMGNPAGCDLGPKVPGKGNLVLFNGVWSQISDLDPMFDINWCIQGFIENTSPSFLFPNEVTDFDITAGANEALNATLSWTNPTITADGSPLTSIDSVIIKRNGEYWASITETSVGENVTWTDERIYESGYYVYSVIPVNEYGTGLFVKDTVTVGTFCETSVYMTDGWGDGWNGNSIQFKTLTGEIVGNAFLEDGATGTMVLSMPNVALNCSWTTGAFPDEVSFIIYNPLEEEVYNCPVGGAANLGGIFANYLNSCTDEVPQAPANFTATSITSDVNLSWVNPSQTIGGNPLTELTNIIIKRNGTIIHVIENPTVGENVAWTDATIPVSGEYEYTITATNEAGIGLSAVSNVVVGDVCNVIIRMYDTFGDGWYGNSAINITKDGIVIGTAKLFSGNFDIDTIIVPIGTLDFVWVAGVNDNECAFIISDHYDIPIYTSSGTPIAGSFFIYENTCAEPITTTISGVVSNSETNAPVANAFLRFTGALNPTAATGENGEYSAEVVVGQSYEVFVTAEGFAAQTQTVNITETSNILNIELVAHECQPPTNLQNEIINEQTIKLTWSNTATITLEAHNVWPDGSGYQMLLDPSANTYGTIIPAVGPLTTSGDAPQSLYDAFEYKIPENADGSTTTSNVIVDGQISIIVPAGTYDYCITNPTANDRIWIASDYCEASGRQNDFVFESGKHYHFIITESENGDCVLLTISDAERSNRTFNVYRDGVQIASDINETSYVDEYTFEIGQNYCYTVETACQNGNTSTLSNESCAEILTVSEWVSNTAIFPNPTDDFCIIEGENIEKVSVFNAMGQLIDEIRITDNRQKISTVSYQNGIYMFRITTEDGRVATKRVVVVR